MEQFKEKRGTIRFEDLGEPVQKLVRSLKGDVSPDDMDLLTYVSVKDMAKIYTEMNSTRHSEEIWEELRSALQSRKEKASRKEQELQQRQQVLERNKEEEEARRLAMLAEEDSERTAAELREKLGQAASAEDAAKDDSDEAKEKEAAKAAAAAEEEAARKSKMEKRRLRREARARELQEEQEALDVERARHAARVSANQHKDWSDYVDSHPLEFKRSDIPTTSEDIPQEKLRHVLNAPPTANTALLNRTYTPKCPNCGNKFAQPPLEWECPWCLKHGNQHIKVWQPDSDVNHCMLCAVSVGRWSRHHCRNCGRLTCSQCCSSRAVILALGFEEPVKVCDDCIKLQQPSAPSGPAHPLAR